MIILDGQHRIKAFEIIKKRLELSDDPEDKRKLDYIRNFLYTSSIYKFNFRSGKTAIYGC